MIVKTRSALAEILRKLAIAGWEHKNFVSLLNCALYIVTAFVRSDVFGIIVIFLENIRNFAPFVAADLDVTVALIVFKENIIFWGVLFNQTALKNERLKLAVCDNVFKVVNIVNHTAHFFCVVILRTKVLADTVSQSLCLSDVNNFTVSGMHNIYPRQKRQCHSSFAEYCHFGIH